MFKILFIFSLIVGTILCSSNIQETCWFICYNENSPSHIDYAKAAMKTISIHAPNINKYLIVDIKLLYIVEQMNKEKKIIKEEKNKINVSTTMILQNEATKNDFYIIDHQVILSRLKSFTEKEIGWQRIARGAYLRIDIPWIINQNGLKCSNYLYTDTDVLAINNDLEKHIQDLKTDRFMVSSEFKQTNKKLEYFNNGVIFGNVSYMQKTYKAFLNHIIKTNFEGFSQYSFNIFYKEEYDFLDNSFNWKPYWGINPNANIVHFHGPKPYNYYGYLKGEKMPDAYNMLLNKNTKTFYQYYVSVYEKYHGEI